MPEGLVKELREVEPTAPLPDRDVRAGRPLLLRSVLRFDTVRALARIGDPGRARPGRPVPRDLHGAGAEDGDRLPRPAQPDVGPGEGLLPARRAGDAAAVRALRPLPRPRPAPRLHARDRLAVPGHAGRPDLRGDRGRGVPVVLHLLRLAVLRAAVRVVAALGVRARLGHGAAGRRLPAPGGAGRARARTSRPSRTRCATRARSSPTGSSRARRSRCSTACATSARSSSSSATSTRSTRC